MFSRGSRQIQLEYSRLSNETKKLQRTVGDVADFKAASDELERLSRTSGASTQEIRAQERALNRLSRRLNSAGVDTADLINEQARLERQLNDTSRSAARANTISASMTGAAGAAIGGGGIATAIAAAGMNMNRQEAVAAAQTGKSVEEIQSSRNDRLNIQKETGADSAIVLANMIQAEQSGAKDDDILELTRTTSQLGAIFTQWQPQEIMAAQMRMMQSFDVSAKQAADILTVTAQKSGDDRDDLLDTFSEYSALMADKGIPLESIAAQFIAGKQAGSWDYDRIADSMKEMLQARITDPTEFAKLVGEGKKAGSIDELIKDKGTALELKNALFELRKGLNSGENIESSYANVMKQLSGLYNSDNPKIKKAARNIAEGVGGSMMAENLGARPIEAMSKAASDPTAILGDIKDATKKAIDVAITPSQQLANSLTVNAQAAATAAAKLEYLAAEPIDTVSNALFGLAANMNDSVGLAGTASVGAIIAGAIATGLGGKLVMGAGRRVLGSLATTAPIASTATQGLSRINTPPAAGYLSRLTQGLSRINTPPATGYLSQLTQGASKYIKPLSIAVTGASLAKSVYDGDNEQTASLTGNVAGGLAGMKAGAMIGAFGGPLGVAIGGAVGGIAGSLIGEEVFSGIYDFFSGKDDPEIDKEIEKSAEIAQTINTSERIKSETVPPPIFELSISAPITVESGAIVPDDFEQQVMSALRNASPELIAQLSQTIHQVIMV